MTDRIQQGGLQVAQVLHQLLEQDIAPGTCIAPQRFWQAFESIVTTLGPRNRALLERREVLQKQIDDWHQQHPGSDEMLAYRRLA